MKFSHKIGDIVKVGGFLSEGRAFKLTLEEWIALDGGSIPSFLKDLSKLDFKKPEDVLLNK